jgi:hypothetical protein
VLLSLVETLCGLASFVFLGRYLRTSTVIVEYNIILPEVGYLPYPTPHIVVIYAMLALFIVSSFGTVGYGVYAYKIRGWAK